MRFYILIGLILAFLSVDKYLDEPQPPEKKINRLELLKITKRGYIGQDFTIFLDPPKEVKHSYSPILNREIKFVSLKP